MHEALRLRHYDDYDDEDDVKGISTCRRCLESLLTRNGEKMRVGKKRTGGRGGVAGEWRRDATRISVMSGSTIRRLV